MPDNPASPDSLASPDSPANPDNLRPLVALPKAHLHLHLEGAMRLGTLQDLAERSGLAVPVPSVNYGNFADFQELYQAAQSALRSLEDLERLVFEVIDDAWRDGAVWIEPAVHLPSHRGLGPDAAVLEVLVDAARRAGAQRRVGTGWLITADRTEPPEEALEQARLAASFVGRGVVAFGLANDEAASPPEAFETAFAVARQAGLICAPHAGEHRGAEAVRAAVDTLGAARVQHGVRAAEDPDVLRLLAERQVCLDVCPTSNVSLSVVPELTAHPLRTLLDAGIPCSINADDPLLFGTGIADEYDACRRVLQLDDATLAACARASLEHSGAPTDVRASALGAIDTWLRVPFGDDRTRRDASGAAAQS